ncbi:MAG TPA: CDP-alcohol phosphatidyltransferase family protein [Methanocorpusculum sp.]|nr:CDP-alcohol phosphatidyltransferase family protein [Candidatus Methanocorpusculum equi]MCQ2357340.1 CDP-alcohol phosphatidyltransferase family protein [Methanocorpusculum sp.]HJJ32821.1 CDP-alcohol phosphatidyltransferase family protein [Methanocorpusculum sp.]HJJ44135.1 CDP-alcohol phosphatidyltransferase family protein [Methanocorpusculum sp.]HJJ58778.1 CDP-alcohol phosphatidyltransferase family protein [Methanocorpusculum sp.]
MSLESLRPKIQWILTPIAKFFSHLPVTPNGWTVVSLFCAFGAGVAFAFGKPLLGVILVLLNAFFDVLDGALARYMNKANPIGDYLDHVFDRYADCAIVIGILVWGIMGTNAWTCPVPAWVIGIFAITGVLLSSYMGTQAQAVGLKRNYGGVLGRADRLILLIVLGVAEFIYPNPIFLGLSFLGWLLVIYGVLGHITAIQRFVMGVRDLKREGRKE